jgi:uncharacterized membrane protein YoaK (UPF0700 family)
MKLEFPGAPLMMAILLAYTSGFVDTLSFIALFGLFAAHVTGNFVLIATSLAEFRHGLWMKILAIPVFIIAAVCTRLYIIRRERGGMDAMTPVLVLQAVVLTVFMAIAVRNEPFKDHDSAVVIVTGLFAAAAMAIQNTAARTFLSDLPPTTVMTGNMMQIIVDVVDLMHGHGAVDAKRARLAKLLPMLLAFIVGTLTGAVGYLTVGFISLLLPIVATAGVSILVKSHPRVPA